MHRGIGVPVAVVAALACVLVSGVVFAQQRGAAVPVIVVFQASAALASFGPDYRADDRAQANPAAWNYVDRGVAGFVQLLERQHGFRAAHVYSAALRGFAASLTPQQIAALQNDPSVAYVEPDGVMTAIAQTLPWGVDRIDADLSSTRAGDGSGAVTGVHAYVIDTGVDAKHADLHVVNHVSFASGPNRDCHGHGTHVAGTIAAKDNGQDVVGVAPGAPLTGVKVLGCSGSGSTSGVIKGIDWVTANAVKPAVANMSLGGGASTTLDNAVKRSADSGVFYSVAAGNDGADACQYSPARAGTHAGVLTTAATSSTDAEPSWSNFGACVDLWAPGVSILSTKQGGGTVTYSGTSMAAPHVAGAGALYLTSWAATAAGVEQGLKSDADPSPAGTVSKDGRAIVIVDVGTY